MARSLGSELLLASLRAEWTGLSLTWEGSSLPCAWPLGHAKTQAPPKCQGITNSRKSRQETSVFYSTNNFYCLICIHGSYMLSFILNLTCSVIPFLNSQHKGFFFIPPDSIACFHFHYSPQYYLLFVYLFVHYLSLLYFMGQKTGHFCKQSIIKGSWQVLNEYIEWSFQSGITQSQNCKICIRIYILWLPCWNCDTLF